MNLEIEATSSSEKVRKQAGHMGRCLGEFSESFPSRFHLSGNATYQDLANQRKTSVGTSLIHGMQGVIGLF
jgi:hypothetical protein